MDGYLASQYPFFASLLFWTDAAAAAAGTRFASLRRIVIFGMLYLALAFRVLRFLSSSSSSFWVSSLLSVFYIYLSLLCICICIYKVLYFLAEWAGLAWGVGYCERWVLAVVLLLFYRLFSLVLLLLLLLLLLPGHLPFLSLGLVFFFNLYFFPSTSCRPSLYRSCYLQKAYSLYVPI